MRVYHQQQLLGRKTGSPPPPSRRTRSRAHSSASPFDSSVTPTRRRGASSRARDERVSSRALAQLSSLIADTLRPVRLVRVGHPKDERPDVFDTSGIGSVAAARRNRFITSSSVYVRDRLQSVRFRVSARACASEKRIVDDNLFQFSIFIYSFFPPQKNNTEVHFSVFVFISVFVRFRYLDRNIIGFVLSCSTYTYLYIILVSDIFFFCRFPLSS